MKIARDKNCPAYRSHESKMSLLALHAWRDDAQACIPRAPFPYVPWRTEPRPAFNHAVSGSGTAPVMRHCFLQHQSGQCDQ